MVMILVLLAGLFLAPSFLKKYRLHGERKQARRGWDDFCGFIGDGLRLNSLTQKEWADLIPVCGFAESRYEAVFGKKPPGESREAVIQRTLERLRRFQTSQYDD
jgi:hypothetical protein